MTQTAPRKSARALSVFALLLSTGWPVLSQADTAAGAATVVAEIKLGAELCNASFYRRCFGVSVQQCQADFASLQPTCDQRVPAPIASLAQALDARNPEPFGEFGRNYGACLIAEHRRLPRYNQATVNACLNSPPFRPGTLVPILELILND